MNKEHKSRKDMKYVLDCYQGDGYDLKRYCMLRSDNYAKSEDVGKGFNVQDVNCGYSYSQYMIEDTITITFEI